MKANANKKGSGAGKTAASAGKAKQPVQPNKSSGPRMQAAAAGGAFGARAMQQPIDPNKTGGVS